MFHFRPFDVCLAELVNDFVILAEIEATLVEITIVLIENTAEFGNGSIEETVLFVDEAVEPGHDPARRGWLAARGSLQRVHRVIEPALFKIDSRQIDRAVR